MDYKFLGRVNSPEDLKKLSLDEVDILCGEIRRHLIDTVSQNGGHLSSNLGAVELTVAIHRVFSSPQDSVIFDVGHQSYAHKLLTGRYDRFSTIRKENGLSGFMRPGESVYDPFVTGHASNSIAAAYGIYKANKMLGKKGTAVAVIGDGAMTGGLALEALNNIGCERSGFIVVVNDNKMSISGNVGSLSRHLKKIRLKPGYYRFKSGTESFLHKVPLVGEPVYGLLSGIKRVFARQVYKNNLFETLGFKYIGPVDGHSVEQTERALRIALEQNKPCVVHAVTVKGKGYAFAEKKPGEYHGVPAFDTHDGISPGADDSFSHVCGKALCELAAKDKRVCAITAAMTSGTGLTGFAEKYPDRFFDVGIAEEYAATFGAGLAAAGMRPYFAVYSSFLQRSYDQLIHDIAIAALPLCLLVDRAGIVGEDGETHQGVFDAAFLTTVPGMTVYSPAGYDELAGCINASASVSSPLAIRYPRGKEKYSFPYTADDYTVFSHGGRVAIVTYGTISANAVRAGEELTEAGIACDVIKLNKIYPISDKLCELLKGYKKVYFFEEGILKGGISEHIVAVSGITDWRISAIEDRFVPAMTVDAAHKRFGLDKDSMIKTIAGDNNG